MSSILSYFIKCKIWDQKHYKDICRLQFGSYFHILITPSSSVVFGEVRILPRSLISLFINVCIPSRVKPAVRSSDIIVPAWWFVYFYLLTLSVSHPWHGLPGRRSGHVSPWIWSSQPLDFPLLLTTDWHRTTAPIALCPRVPTYMPQRIMRNGIYLTVRRNGRASNENTFISFLISSVETLDTTENGSFPTQQTESYSQLSSAAGTASGAH